MQRNKIRFRKKIISPDNIDQYRDYTRLVERHERYMKLRTLYRFLIYFAITTILLVLILVAIWKVKDEQYRKKHPQAVVKIEFKDSKIQKFKD
jgi:hypothetical protein